MSRTYRKSNVEFGFRKNRINDLVTRHENQELMDYEVKHYQPIINKKNFKQALLKKYYHSDGHGYVDYSRNPGWWNHIYGEVKLRRISRDILKKVILLKDLEDTPIIPEKVYVPYYW